MARGKRFIGLVLNERQAKTLLMYLRCLDEHAAGKIAARSLRAIRVKLAKSLEQSYGDSRSDK